MKRRPLVAFFVLMFGISWGVWLPLADVLQDAPGLPESSGWPGWLQVLGAFGPCLAALIVTAADSGVAGLRELFGRLLRWRVHVGWYLVALLLPAGISLLITAIHMMFGGNAPDFTRAPILGVNLPGFLQGVPVVVAIVPVFMLQLFTGSSLGEELGWRGFALTRLQVRLSALDATLVIAFVWAVWAQPFFHLQRVQAGAWMAVEDVRDIRVLADRLNRGSDPVSRFLQEQLSPGLRAALTATSDARLAVDDLKYLVVAELNQVLYQVPLYDEERFENVPLSRKTRELLALPDAAERRLRLNRLLLEDAYPESIGRPATVYIMPFILLMIGVIPAQILITWLYNSTGGSLLLVVLYNNALKITDLFVAAPNAGQFVPAAAYWLVALLVVSAVGTRHLTLKPGTEAGSR